MILNQLKYKYIKNKSIVRCFSGGKLNISKSVRISKSIISAYNGSNIEIGQNCIIENAEIYVENGSIKIDDFTIIRGTKNEKVIIIINNGQVTIKDHSGIFCKKIWVRFGGMLDIGRYTNINAGSEIRCDEKVSIGSYNQISYNIKIWDTNTHTILEPQERRKIAEKYFPYFGYEKERPKTAPVEIGDDCWIGENSAVFKGTTIGNESIVGYNTFITGKNIPPKSRVINERILKITPIEA